jgi:hypothetical protein
MAFENISKRRLAFAPKIINVKSDQADLRILTQETNYAHTERISAPAKMVHVMSEGTVEMFVKLPELTLLEGHLSLAAAVTLIAAKLLKIDGDLHLQTSARFYAPLLEEVTGFIYVGEGATINAPKIEPLLSNDDMTRIEKKAGDWLDTL